MQAFPPFRPIPSQYPAPVPEIQFSSSTYPTNSWFQNAITDAIPDPVRVGNALPWYWLPSYDERTFNLSHVGANPFTNTTTNGNLIVQEAPGHDITVGSSDATSLRMTNLDDFTATFEQRSPDGTITAYPMRGSPFATFLHQNVPVRIRFNTQPNITAFERIDRGYYLDTMAPATTTTNTSMVDGRVNELFFYHRLDRLDVPVSATLEGNSIFIIQTLGVTGRVVLGSSTDYSALPSTVSSVSLNSNRNFPSMTINMTNGDVYVVSANLDPQANPRIVTATYITQEQYRWLIYTEADLTRSGNIIMSSSSHTGPVQLARGDPRTENHNLYAQYAGNYVISGTTTNFSGGMNDDRWSFFMQWNKIGGDVLWLLPYHWTRMSLTGIERLNGMVNSFIYGRLTLTRITNNMTSVLIPGGLIPTGPDVSDLSPDQKNRLRELLLREANFLVRFLPMNADPYGYGTAAAALGRILVLGNLLGVKNELSSIIATLKNSLISWMTGTNGRVNRGNPFQLQYDQIWGGVLIPGDYLITIGGADVGSFGNSFYNDHHFHWGYLLYALYTLELIGEGISSQYPDQITGLILDIANPVTSNFSWKTRHKDWYAGHSWATGIEDAVNRQQESSSEAINGYYAAYLMSKILRRDDLAAVSGVCLWLEILASQDYYQFQAPGTQIGIMSEPGGLGIMQILGKSFTLDWGMQPDSFNGRAIGIYGIQVLPFTEMTWSFLSSDWVDHLSLTVPSYAMTADLIIGLMSDYYEPIPTPNENPAQGEFNVERDGTFWGAVGLKILGVSPRAMTNEQIRTAFESGLQKQTQYDFPIVKQFDSFTNTLYWLMKLRRI